MANMTGKSVLGRMIALRCVQQYYKYRDSLGSDHQLALIIEPYCSIAKEQWLRLQRMERPVPVKKYYNTHVCYIV